ncbi:hypothetical protein LEN26_015267 [Aphanomyces euteiches]|nr:hypothetical protein LEN26_015267 [Aphanomyces euteiches]
MQYTRAPSLDSSVNNDGAVRIFKAIECSSILAKLHLVPSKHTTILVHFPRAIVSLRRNNKVINIDANHLIVKPRGQTDVLLQYALDDWSTRYIFSSELEAVLFVGAVQLVQHMAVLEIPQVASPECDGTLVQFTKYTLQFAEDLWSAHLWKKSYKFYSIVDTLRAAVANRQGNMANFKAVALQLSDLCDRFESEASMEESVQVDGENHYIMTPVAILLAKIRALQQHASIMPCF